MATEETSEKMAVRAVASFRQRGGYINARNKVGGAPKRSGGSLYGSRFAPSEDYQDEILLVPSTYETPLVNESNEVENVLTEYFFYRQHYDSRRRKFTHCSGGPYYKNRHMAEYCLGCHINHELTVWEDRKPVKQSHVSWARPMRAFTLIHFHRYHWVEQNRNGQLVLNPKDQKPYMEWVRCLEPLGERCWMCEQEKKTIEARRMHWSLGPTHHNSLEYHNIRVASNCINCGGTNTINWEAWVCPHCEYAHVERDTTKFTAKEVDSLIMTPILCPNCGQRDFAREEYYCEECGKSAVRTSIFDMRLLVQKEIQMASRGKQTVVNIASGQIEKDPKQYKGLYEPLDLAEMFAPDSLEAQSKKFEWDIPDEWTQPVERVPARDYE